MFKVRHTDPDADDMLVAIPPDGNVIIDRNIRQELGMIISDTYNMAVRNDELVSFVEWLRADSPPVGKGNAFFLADEPRHLTEDSTIMNRVLPSLYNKAALGRTQLQVAKQRMGRTIKAILAGAVAVTFLMVFAVVPMCRSTELLPIPDHVIEQIIEAQERQGGAQ